MRQASLWAVAVMAVGAPRRAFRRRWKAPRADRLWERELAARRRAAATRLAEGLVRPLIFLPPETLLPGARLSQEAKGFSVGHRVMSSPISATILRAVGASTPVRRWRCWRASKLRAVRRAFRGRGAADSAWPPRLFS